MSTEVRETCREWPADALDRCNEPAEVILWGKLFPREALGPRCRFHAEKYFGGMSMIDALRQNWAIFDLRNLRRTK